VFSCRYDGESADDLNLLVTPLRLAWTKLSELELRFYLSNSTKRQTRVRYALPPDPLLCFCNINAICSWLREFGRPLSPSVDVSRIGHIRSPHAKAPKGASSGSSINPAVPFGPEFLRDFRWRKKARGLAASEIIAHIQDRFALWSWARRGTQPPQLQREGVTPPAGRSLKKSSSATSLAPSLYPSDQLKINRGDPYGSSCKSIFPRTV
jgi:hypothetical protein